MDAFLLGNSIERLRPTATFTHPFLPDSVARIKRPDLIAPHAPHSNQKLPESGLAEDMASTTTAASSTRGEFERQRGELLKEIAEVRADPVPFRPFPVRCMLTFSTHNRHRASSTSSQTSTNSTATSRPSSRWATSFRRSRRCGARLRMSWGRRTRARKGRETQKLPRDATANERAKQTPMRRKM